LAHFTLEIVASGSASEKIELEPVASDRSRGYKFRSAFMGDKAD
jgi:hypothetical protein